jgi:hypothetical protein
MYFADRIRGQNHCRGCGAGKSAPRERPRQACSGQPNTGLEEWGSIALTSRTQGCLLPQLVTRRHGGNIGAVEAHRSIELQKIHDRRWIRAVRQPQEVPDLVYRCREKFVGRQCHSRVERDPALKRSRRGKLRACRLRRLEKPGVAVDNLNRAFAAVLGMPFHVEHVGPKAHGASKGRGNSRFRCCEADTQTHVTGLGQFGMSIARVVVTGPIARAFAGAHAAGDRQAEYRRERPHASLDARPLRW